MKMTLKEFQKETVETLCQLTDCYSEGPKVKKCYEESTILLRACTGSGKTVMLLSFIEEYIKNNNDVAFIWLSPGKGDLEEQSKEKMDRICDNYLKSHTLNDLLNQGINSRSVYFLNWEALTRTNNTATKEGEKKNIYERIKDAHKVGITFILIIDEENTNDTSNAKSLIEYFNALYEIRASATPVERPNCKYVDIPENRVISEELISKALYINKDITVKDFNANYDETEVEVLLSKAIEMTENVKDEYKKLGKNINPLILIQFPNMKNGLIHLVEDVLKSKGYTFENGLVASWFSDGDYNKSSKEECKNFNVLKKRNLEENGKSIVEPDAKPEFLLFKQAIAVGWDCPRAKILVKLRENMNENFAVQTLGRIRRMPEAKHYNNDVLDYSYLYTFDERFTKSVLKQGSYPVRKVSLKDGIKLNIQKETPAAAASQANLLETYKKLSEYIKDYFNIKEGDNKSEIIEKMENQNYNTERTLSGSIVSGKIKNIEKFNNNDSDFDKYCFDKRYDGRIHFLIYKNAIRDLSEFIGLNSDNTESLLLNLFAKQKRNSVYKILDLEGEHFKVFVMNNKERLEKMLDSFIGGQYKNQMSLNICEIEPFEIPEEELYLFVPSIKTVKEMGKNAYEKYTEEMLDGKVKTKAEIMFETYCESIENLEFVYKNKDSGREYFSLVYLNKFAVPKLFYPDYLLKIDGKIWIIEAKGGFAGGENKNIDKNAEFKFKELKEYAETNDYNFGFVRYVDEKLYINNTDYTEEMEVTMPNCPWIEIEKVIPRN